MDQQVEANREEQQPEQPVAFQIRRLGKLETPEPNANPAA